ncbi:MAG TPA: hypothetical protein VGD96_08560 [Bradyrhizobium sp.]
MTVKERSVRLHCVATAEMRGKPAASRSLHRGGGSFRLRQGSQRLQARLVALQHTSFLLKPVVLRLQQALLRTLRPRSFRLPGLQFLHALLQAVDAALPRGALTRKRRALPLLHGLLSLLDRLLAPARAGFGLLLPRRPRAHRGRCARPRRRGDVGSLLARYRRTLR